MHIEPNPGPLTATSGQFAIDAYPSGPTRATIQQYTVLFNATKRIQLKLTQYKLRWSHFGLDLFTMLQLKVFYNVPQDDRCEVIFMEQAIKNFEDLMQVNRAKIQSL